MKDFLSELNDAQRDAVQCTDGPIMVIAGAGSGKTRVLTYKIAYLLQKGVDPFNILALTFTNKAAKEMKERVHNVIGGSEAKNVWLGTFHSVFAKVLRVEHERLGYLYNFTIYDTDDSKSVIKSIVKDLQLDDKIYQASHVLNRISSAKTSLISVNEYNQNAEIIENDKAAQKPMLGKIYATYQQRCFRASAMDFDDILYNMNVLLQEFPDVLYKYQNKFKYILVDEYQDTNYAQYLIIKKLAANNENICVVGDDAQSIYAFRGATIQNILNFKKDYPDFKIFKLEQNYRSTKIIVNAANEIISNNKDQIFKEIWTENDQGSKITLIKALTDSEEGFKIASSIFEQKMNFQMSNNSFAVLYRTNAQSRSIEEALRKLNIPYRIYGGLSFFKRKEIKDILAYFRLIVNFSDEEALIRIINYPARGIGKTTLERITVIANENNVPLWEVIVNSDKIQIGINNPTIQKLQEFAYMIKSFSSQLNTKNACDLAKLVVSSSGIFKELNEDKTPEGINRQENVQELLNGIRDFTDKSINTESDAETNFRTLSEYMQDISLITDADVDDPENTNTVTLMTIHAAKGLEFPYVYVSGMEENLFPSQLSITSRADLEEERRLFYVAVTRAMDKLFLSYAENRYRWGELKSCEPSRFLEEIDEKYIEQSKRFSSKNADNQTFEKIEAKPIFNQKTLKTNIKALKTNNFESKAAHLNINEPFQPAEISEIKEGLAVEHQKFGKGIVVSIEGSGPDSKAIVDFPVIGHKQLLLKYAKLKVISN